jgi:hypothetical protein
VHDWSQFRDFGEFVDFVSKRDKAPFHSRVARDAYFSGLGTFFTLFFPNMPASKKEAPVNTALGPLSHNGLLLDPGHLFAMPLATMLRQGDLLKATTSFPQVGTNPTHWIIASQTCAISKDPFSQVIPAYLKSSFQDQLETIHPDLFAKKDAARKSAESSLFDNRTNRFLVLPPKDGSLNEPLVIDLGQLYTMARASLKGLTALLSLTYPGLAYFSNRLAINVFRDVADCDDARAVSGS